MKNIHFLAIVCVMSLPLSYCLAQQPPQNPSASPASAPEPSAAPAQVVAPVPAPAQEPGINPAWKHELSITINDDGKWGCSLENARAVIVSAVDELWKYFPESKKMPRIEVTSKGGPIFYYNIGADAHAKIMLSSGDHLWAQMAYQSAHEFCHLLCWFPCSNTRPQSWFQETLCEVASRFALKQMSETWKTNPPYSNWKDYAASLRGYFDNLQNNNRVPEGKTLGQWYKENAASQTYISPVVSAELFEILDAKPEYWEAVSWFPREKIEPDTFQQFLRVWRKNLPDRLKPFIDAVAAKFEMDVSEPAPAP